MENDINNFEKNSNVSLGEWLITFLIMIIPVVNIVMLFIWAFGGEVKESKANWAKALLVWIAICIFISSLFLSLIMSAFASFFNY